MVRLEHVYKIYSGSIYALRDINLNIEKGEFVYLTGHSGAGKTTLFRLITCYDRPTSGAINVAGYDFSRVNKEQVPFVRRKIGVVFQDFKLLKNRTVAENVVLPLEVINARPHSHQDQVKTVLEQVGLRFKADFYPDQLSGGEQQRVAIARALISKPGLLIADEPTGNLDQALSEEIMELFEKINSQGTTVVIATHNMSLIKKSGRRVLMLEKGELSERKRPSDSAVVKPSMTLQEKELL